jgi:putative transcriptional regulator
MRYTPDRGREDIADCIRRIASVVIGVLAIVAGWAGQAQAQTFGAKPFFLVARADMPDPTFQHSVILMLPPTEDSPVVAGVIINQPMRLTLDDLFQHMDTLKHRDEHAYFGGPVDYSLPLLITRGSKPARHAIRILDSLYVSGGVETVASIVTQPWSPKDARLFLGRAQWAPEQLRGEILKGAWDALPLNVDLVFSPDPKSVWRTLQKETHLREVKGGSRDGARGELVNFYGTRDSSPRGVGARLISFVTLPGW